MAILVEPTENKKYEDEMVMVKGMILERVKDHVIPHISEKNTSKEMWDALITLY